VDDLADAIRLICDRLVQAEGRIQTVRGHKVAALQLEIMGQSGRPDRCGGCRLLAYLRGDRFLKLIEQGVDSPTEVFADFGSITEAVAAFAGDGPIPWTFPDEFGK
jgi:hypothetical protein